MKLSILSEQDITRRDALKRVAGTLSTALISKGIPLDVARKFTDDKPLWFFTPIEMSGGRSITENIPPMDLLQRIAKMAVGDIRVANFDGESLNVRVRISPSDAAGLVAGADHLAEADVGMFEFERSDWPLTMYVGKAKYDPMHGEAYDDCPKVKNLLVSWWDEWGQYSTGPMSDTTFNLLKSNKINPAVREDWVKNEIDEIINGSTNEDFIREYGDKHKYGILDEIVPNDDDRLANPMHQPFEGRLKRRLDAVLEVVTREPIRATSSLLINEIDPEEDWEMADRVYQIANNVGIRFNRNKDVYIVAMVGDDVVGGVAIDDAYLPYHHEGDDENYMMDFDVVVDPQWQGYQNVGIKLIDSAERFSRGLGVSQVTALVVNGRLAKLMGTKLGYDGYDELEGAPCRLYKHV